MKTAVEFLCNSDYAGGYQNFDTGYIDGYVALDTKTYAVVVLDKNNYLYLVPLNHIKAIKQEQ